MATNGENGKTVASFQTDQAVRKKILHLIKRKRPISVNNRSRRLGDGTDRHLPLKIKNTEPFPGGDSVLVSRVPENSEHGRVRCDECGQTYSSPHLLSKHIRRTHLKEKHHLCQYCEYQAYNRREVILHEQRVHIKNKCYKCPHLDCSYATTDNEMLYKHLATHSATKAFRCEHCPYTCCWKNQLARHAQAHASRERVTCEECGVVSRDRKQYLVHYSIEHSVIRTTANLNLRQKQSQTTGAVDAAAARNHNINNGHVPLPDHGANHDIVDSKLGVKITSMQQQPSGAGQKAQKIMLTSDTVGLSLAKLLSMDNDSFTRQAAATTTSTCPHARDPQLIISKDEVANHFQVLNVSDLVRKQRNNNNHCVRDSNHCVRDNNHCVGDNNSNVLPSYADDAETHVQPCTNDLVAFIKTDNNNHISARTGDDNQRPAASNPTQSVAAHAQQQQQPAMLKSLIRSDVRQKLLEATLKRSAVGGEQPTRRDDVVTSRSGVAERLTVAAAGMSSGAVICEAGFADDKNGLHNEDCRREVPMQHESQNEVVVKQESQNEVVVKHESKNEVVVKQESQNEVKVQQRNQNEVKVQQHNQNEVIVQQQSPASSALARVLDSPQGKSEGVRRTARSSDSTRQPLATAQCVFHQEQLHTIPINCGRDSMSESRATAASTATTASNVTTAGYDVTSLVNNNIVVTSFSNSPVPFAGVLTSDSTVRGGSVVTSITSPELSDDVITSFASSQISSTLTSFAVTQAADSAAAAANVLSYSQDSVDSNTTSTLSFDTTTTTSTDGGRATTEDTDVDVGSETEADYLNSNNLDSRIIDEILNMSEEVDGGLFDDGNQHSVYSQNGAAVFTNTNTAICSKQMDANGLYDQTQGSTGVFSASSGAAGAGTCKQMSNHKLFNTMSSETYSGTNAMNRGEQLHQQQQLQQQQQQLDTASLFDGNNAVFNTANNMMVDSNNTPVAGDVSMFGSSSTPAAGDVSIFGSNGMPAAGDVSMFGSSSSHAADCDELTSFDSLDKELQSFLELLERQQHDMMMTSQQYQPDQQQQQVPVTQLPVMTSQRQQQQQEENGNVVLLNRIDVSEIINMIENKMAATSTGSGGGGGSGSAAYDVATTSAAGDDASALLPPFHAATTTAELPPTHQHQHTSPQTARQAKVQVILQVPKTDSDASHNGGNRAQSAGTAIASIELSQLDQILKQLLSSKK